MFTYNIVTLQSYRVSNSNVCYQLMKLSLIIMESEDIFVQPVDEGHVEKCAMVVTEAGVTQLESQES